MSLKRRTTGETVHTNYLCLSAAPAKKEKNTASSTNAASEKNLAGVVHRFRAELRVCNDFGSRCSFQMENEESGIAKLS